MVGRLQFRQSTSDMAGTPCIILDNGGMGLLVDINDNKTIRHRLAIPATRTRYFRMNASEY